MGSERIWQKRRIVVDRLNFRQNQMFKVGTVGVASVINRVQAALGPDDAAAKLLTKRYAIQKSRLRLGNRRNLVFTGNMLRNLAVQPWLVFSPKNKAAVVEAARRVFQESVKRLSLERMLGGRQQ